MPLERTCKETLPMHWLHQDLQCCAAGNVSHNYIPTVNPIAVSELGKVTSTCSTYT